MEHDHRYVRQLLQLREPPQLPVLWLLVPWLAVVAWSAYMAYVLRPVELPLRPGGAFVLAAFAAWWLVMGGIGVALSWAWLYFAWPEHPRVLCWGALAGIILMRFTPLQWAAVLPLFVSLAMSSAVIEQVSAARRARVPRTSNAPAV